MKIYFAPMEGITLAPFRQVYQGFFPYIDKYFSPFLVANQTLHFQNKEIRDILPENNKSIPLVPQVLSNKPEEMLWAVRTLRDTFGYREVNLNLGCSMPQVANRGRGAGFLGDKERLLAFFEEVFEGLRQDEREQYETGRGDIGQNEIGQIDVRWGNANQEKEKQNHSVDIVALKLSVKTRIGMEAPSEAGQLIEIFNRFPISELIIHPRTRRDLYDGQPNIEAFSEMYQASTNPVCYNGDIYTLEDYQKLTKRFPKLDRIMIGRGLLRNPALARELSGGSVPDLEELRKYHDAVYGRYLQIMQDKRQAVTKMKGIWTYWQVQFPGREKLFKKLRKSVWPEQYEECVAQIMVEEF